MARGFERQPKSGRFGAAIMPDVLARLEDGECMMPHDLVNFGPLSLAKAESRDDFRRALLVKSRDGRFLGPTPP